MSVKRIERVLVIIKVVSSIYFRNLHYCFGWNVENTTWAILAIVYKTNFIIQLSSRSFLTILQILIKLMRLQVKLFNDILDFQYF